MTGINRIFLGFMIVAGLAAGFVLVAKPELRDFRISPYFWILIAMALFELAAFARGRGAPGTMLAIEIRLLGFVLAIVLMVAVPILAGSPARLF
ncbi:MAG: hypothetical protein E6G97_26315 [Alphaproteobacteria bacterium]|nr:MAG: hypothetical protein E6G97_26315 [Alphaproteobacteria bacterium]